MMERLYGDRLDEVIRRELRSPEAEPPVDFSLWSFAQAGLKGVPRAGFERAGTLADALSVFGETAATLPGGAGGMFAGKTDAELADERKATERMRAGDLGNAAAGNALRRKATELAPPETAHAADKVVGDFVRFGAKAVFDVSTMGPIAGGVVFGLDEGNTASRNLQAQGVDAATANRVGAVQGAIGAATVGLPLFGRSLAGTLGLVAISGPGSYVAQESLSREILQRGGYDDEAKKHDPTDPLGLALSTIIPGGFAAYGRRAAAKSLQDAVKEIESGGRRYGKDGQLLTSPKGAQGEMQVMPGTATDPGFGVTPAQDNSPDELARVGRDYLAAMGKRYGDQDKQLAAYNAGPGAVDNAVKKLGDDWLKAMPEETRAYVAKANKLLRGDAVARAADDPEAVAAARVQVLQSTLRDIPDSPGAYQAFTKAMDDIGDGIPPVLRFEMPLDDRMRAVDVELERTVVERGEAEPQPLELALQTAARDDPTPQQVEQAITWARDNGRPDIVETIVQRTERVAKQAEEAPPVDPAAQRAPRAPGEPEPRRVDPIRAREAADVARSVASVPRLTPAAPRDVTPGVAQAPAETAPNGLPRPDSVTLADAPAKPAARPGQSAQEAGPASNGQPGDGPAVDAARLQQVEAESPDVLVTLDDQQMTLAEAMQKAKDDAEFEAGEADLVKVAAECALGIGAV